MQLTGKARLAGIMGWPVGHSLSPRLHGHWFARYGIDGAYVPLPIAAADLELAFEALPRLGFRGWNVTVPHKEAACRLVDELDPAAARIGALNTVLVLEDGRTRGSTPTVWASSPICARWRPTGAPRPARPCCSGPAVARAASGRRCWTPACRAPPDQPQPGAGGGSGRASSAAVVVPWAERGDALAETALLVNCTSLGMAGQPPLELPLDRLPIAAVVADLVYVPLETPLLAAARARGPCGGRRAGHAAASGRARLQPLGRGGTDGGCGAAPHHAGQVTGMPGTPAANLDGIRLLAPLTPAERAALAARCSWRRFRRGELVLSRDSDAATCCSSSPGGCACVNYAASGREVAYAMIEAGSHVGELAALDGEPRSASVEALDDCLIAALPSGPFHELLLAHRELAVTLLKNLARIIRRTDERIAELSVLGAMQRVYRELLRLAQPQPDGSAHISPLPTQEELAALVGTTRETVARALGQLTKSGIARRRGRELMIANRSGSKRWASPTAEAGKALRRCASP